MQFGKGWIPSRPDARDHLFAAHPVVTTATPPSAFLQCPPVWNQLWLGSCTAHGAGMGVAILALIAGLGIRVVSRLQVYLEARRLLGPQYVGIDSGAMGRDAIKVLASALAGPESLWPYDIDRFTETPPQEVYDVGVRHPLTGYTRCAAVSEYRASIAAKFPVPFGFTVRQGQLEEAGTTGILKPYADRGIDGGHFVCGVGYDDHTARALVRNSWGKDWGIAIPGQEALGNGNFWVPYDWLFGADVSDQFSLMNWRP